MYSVILKGIKIIKNDGLTSFANRFFSFIKYKFLNFQRRLRLQLGLMWIGGARIKVGVNPPQGVISLLNSSLEIEERAFARMLPSEVPVIELGSGVGLVSHEISRTLHEDVEHIMVEANPDLIPILKNTCTLNEISGKIINSGYNTREKNVSIQNEESTYVHAETKKAGSGPTVEAITVEKILEDISGMDFSLVVDIEGAENDLLDEWELIENHCTTVLIEYHSGSEQIREKIESSKVFQCSGYIGDVCYYERV